jgi:hypothetical protein
MIVDEEAVVNVEAAIALDKLYGRTSLFSFVRRDKVRKLGREFLTAMTIAPHSQLAKSPLKRVESTASRSLLVSIDRPNTTTTTTKAARKKKNTDGGSAGYLFCRRSKRQWRLSEK